MNKFINAAIEILTDAKKPLHYKDITKLALNKGILETDGATPESSMNSQIIIQIRKKGAASDFIKTAPSTYSINTAKKSIAPDKAKKIIEEEAIEEAKEKIESGYTGKAGEYLVCSELLFRGYNASIMSLDMGIDIIATKLNKLFSIQVKTSNLNSFNYYNFDIRKTSFQKAHSGSVFYLFVLKDKQENNFFILPHVVVEQKVHEKAILEINNGNTYRVNIRMRDGKIFLGNKEHEMGYYFNNWDIIK
jgi:Holliday junction resolvase-like predicted endonuclease